MTKKKTPIKQNGNFLITLLLTLLLVSFLYTSSISKRNTNLNDQLKKINNSEIIKSSLNDRQVSVSTAIDLVLSKNEVKNIFCNNKNIHISMSEEFEDSWQIRIVQDGPADQFGLKEYRVDKNTREVTENTYRK